MAYIDHQWGSSYIVELGNGATPSELFTPIVVLNANKNLKTTVETATAQIRDADNPDLMAKTVRKALSSDSTITGGGQVQPSAMLALYQWQLSGAAKSVKFKAPKGGVIVSGKYILTNIDVKAQTDSIVEADFTFEQADVVAAIAST